MLPVKPDLALYVTELVVPVADTSAGAWNLTGRIATGIRTT